MITPCNVLLLQSPLTLRKEDASTFGFFPPLGLAYIASVLLQSGIKVEIRDLLVEGGEHPGPVDDKGRVRLGLSEREIEDVLLSANPGIVGISNNFTSFSADCVRLAGIVRGCLPNALVVMGGAHAGMEPESLLRTGMVDAVVLGEGEFVFRDLARAVFEGRLDVARRLAGTVWRIGEEIIENGWLASVLDVDAIPFPAYHLLPMERYIWQKRANFSVAMRRPIGHIITTRGCPYNCVFCSTTKYFKKFRKRSPENVLREINILIKNYGIREFHFLDDSFAADPEHVSAICRMIIERGLDIRWQPAQGVNSNRLDEALLTLMQRSGMYRIGFPIESGSQEMLRFIRKPILLTRMKSLIETCNRLGIYCFGCFMIGFPEESKEQLQETLDFVADSGLDYVKISIVQPLPGSELHSIYVRLGLYADEAEESSTFFHTAYDTVYFKAEELNRIRAEAFRAFSQRRIRNILCGDGFKRFILPKLRSWEDVAYFLKVTRLALRGY